MNMVGLSMLKQRDIDYGYNSSEIKNADEYNEKYNLEMGSKSRDGKYKARKSNHPNEFDRFYEKMSDKEKQRLCESYMTFFDYYAIYGQGIKFDEI